MNTIKVTKDVSFVTMGAEVGRSIREFAEIAEIIESIDLTDIIPDKAKLFIGSEEGHYTIYPIGCRITGYTKRQPTPSQGLPIPIKETTTEVDGGIRIKRQDIFLSTEVTLLYQSPEHISQRLLEEKV